MKINVTSNDMTTLDTTPEQALEAGHSPDAVAAAVKTREAEIHRDTVRADIAKNAGDTLSLLGTTSDASTIAVLVGACFMASLDETTSYSAFRAKANAFMQAISGEHDPTEIAKAFLASVQAGDVRLPALEKGIVEVLAEVTERGNAVAEAIAPKQA
jgi:hypothetical protein